MPRSNDDSQAGSMTTAELVQSVLSFQTVVVDVPKIKEHLNVSWWRLDALVQAACKDGLIQVTEDPSGLQNLSLTPLAAEQLGIVLDFNSSRWYRTDAVPPDVAEGVSGLDREPTHVNFDSIQWLEYEEWMSVDYRASSPLNVLIAQEVIARLDRIQKKNGGKTPEDERTEEYYRPPQQRHLLGLRDIWPIADPKAQVKPGCSICRDIDMKFNDYCVWCDRSGLDYTLPTVGKAVLRKPYNKGSLRGGTG